MNVKKCVPIFYKNNIFIFDNKLNLERAIKLIFSHFVCIRIHVLSTCK